MLASVAMHKLLLKNWAQSTCIVKYLSLTITPKTHFVLCYPREPRPGESGFRFHASRPEALALDFVVRPDSKIDPETVRARAKALQRDEKRQKVGLKFYFEPLYMAQAVW